MFHIEETLMMIGDGNEISYSNKVETKNEIDGGEHKEEVDDTSSLPEFPAPKVPRQ